MDREPNPTGLGEPILYVDDELDAREAFQAAARELGFQVDTADGGAEALAMTSRQRYAVVACDLRMPTLNGLSLIQLLQPRWPEASYLIVTGVAHLDLPAGSNGSVLVDEVISKPWSLDELSRILGRALDRHRERSAAEPEKPPPGGAVLLLTRDESFEADLREKLQKGPAVRKVTGVGNLEQALELATRGNFEVALVPVGTGSAHELQSIARLRRAAPQTALIALGVLDEVDAARRARKAGAQDYLVEGLIEPYALSRSIDYAVERKSTEDRLSFAARHDAVTGVGNRAFLLKELKRAMARADRQGSRLALLVLDLDRFKSVNDSLGHELGDRLLKLVSQRLEENVPEAGTVARLGGDEFAILLENVHDDKGCLATAQRLLEAMVPPARLGEYEIASTASIGIAIYPEHGESSGELLQNADRAMYRAKNAGRDGYALYTTEGEESRSGALERLRFESNIRYALERGEYLVFYQPRATLDCRRIVAVEALLRWNHPRAGLVSPAKFIPLLESSGLIEDVGEWVLRTACRQIKAWQDDGFPSLRVAVNLSARQFQGSDLITLVESGLREAGLPPDSLELEITESLLMRDTEQTRAILDRLKTLGVRIAIDDFGTGYSSLSYLTRFRLDCLKIDRSFVRDICSDVSDQAVARAIIGLGESLGLDVVAEGVENAAQLEHLDGCDGFQGFLVSRPQPADDVRELLNRYTVGTPSSVH